MVETIFLNSLIAISSLGVLIYFYSSINKSKLSTTLLLSKYSSYALVVASLSAFFIALNLRELQVSWFNWHGLGLDFKLDTLNGTLLVMVSLIGMVVTKFSRSYLEGDIQHRRFLGLLTGVIASVQLLLLSANIVTFFISWLCMSAFLQQLLLTYSNREKARLAAKKKFILARIGDLTLLIAFILLYRASGTGNIPAILTFLESSTVLSSSLVTVVGCCFVITAVLKSAQFPLHGWLIEVMEAPTPVSAILHAGLINAGPFLILRFAPIVFATNTSNLLLFTFAILSTCYAALIFPHQPSIKNSLGYSSVAHLGFTLLLCSLGLYSAALLHLVAHSFFKAYQFLSSGSEIDRNRITVPTNINSNLIQQIVKVVLIMAVTAALTIFAWYMYKEAKNMLYLYFFFLFAITLYSIKVSSTISSWLLQFSTLAFMVITMLCFYLFESLVGKSLSTVFATSAFQDLLLYITIAVLSMLILLRLVLIEHPKLGNKISVHLRNGLYVNLIMNRLFGEYNK